MTGVAIDNDNVDLREQLFNDGAIGKIQEIQLSTERLVKLHGILFDLDPKLFRVSSILPHLPSDPSEFYAAVARRWLDRHPLLRNAEVRNSGTGLHVIIQLDEPVIFNSAGEQERWAGIVKVVQCALPIDPDQPGITAVTRPIGSVNGKNGATVTMLKAGTSVSQDDILGLYEEMVSSSFKSVMQTVTGATNLEPCPVCNAKNSKLTALDSAGECYGSCGRVYLENLFDALLVPRGPAQTEAADHGETKK